MVKDKQEEEVQSEKLNLLATKHVVLYFQIK